MNPKFYRTALIVLGVGVMAVAGLVLKQSVPSLEANQLTAIQGSPPTQINAFQEHNRWLARIGEIGAEQAYQELKQTYASSSIDVQHTAAHVFGPLLYDAVGTGGIAICDSSFSFGCYHGFFTAALNGEGLGIVKNLDAVCIDKYGIYGTGCQHGIGHGLLEYLGYDNLVKALEACKLTTQKNILRGCTSGVFMEYNVPLVLGDATARTGPRALNHANPYEPCTDIPKHFRESCYHELGQWWDKVYHGDYTAIGQLCARVSEDVYREDCYLGVGNVVASSALFDVAAAIDRCEKMPDAEGKLICRAGASWSFFANIQYRDLAPRLCEGVESYRDYSCVRQADIFKTKNSEQAI